MIVKSSKHKAQNLVLSDESKTNSETITQKDMKRAADKTS